MPHLQVVFVNTVVSALVLGGNCWNRDLEVHVQQLRYLLGGCQ
jgi:hypothetical protein